jgi:mannosyltransferase OCH1-like enzyme
MQKIPKSINFIWVGNAKMPEKYQRNISEWAAMYSDYKIVVWDDVMIDQHKIIPDELLEEYHSNQLHPTYKADLARYNIIHRYGGIYIDADFECLKRMPDSFLEFEFLGGIQNNGEVAIGFFAASPECELLTDAIERLPINIEYRRLAGQYRQDYIHKISGPEFFSDIAKQYYTRSDHWFFTPEYFYPYSWNEPNRSQENFKQTCPLAYAVHKWHKTWNCTPPQSHKILIGIPAKNTAKFLPNLFNQLWSLDYDKKLITIVLAEGDSIDNTYSVCQQFAKSDHPFASVEVLKLDFGYHLGHDLHRYDTDKFPRRIKGLVETRNFIVNRYAKNNDYVWWVDSDFETIPTNTLNFLIACDKDIVIPALTHEKWGYHDCGSVVFEGDCQKRFQYYPSETGLVKIDRADTHCLIKTRVFDTLRYKFVDAEYLDGCGGKQNCWSDGTWFSIEANKQGYSVYGAKHIAIKHHNV